MYPYNIKSYGLSLFTNKKVTYFIIQNAKTVALGLGVPS